MTKLGNDVIVLDRKEIDDVRRDQAGLDSLRVAQAVGFVPRRPEADRGDADGIKLNTLWICEKWSEDALNFARKRLKLPSAAEVSSAILRSLKIPEDIGVHVVPNNALLNEGITELIDLIADTEGGSAVLFDNTNARIGVGSSSAAFAASQTDLQDGTPTYKAMNGGYPTRSSQTANWQSDFTSGEANEAWEEWTVANGASGSAVNLNRRVQSLGTKATGTWTLTGSITFS